MDWTTTHQKLKELDEGVKAGKDKLLANFEAVKAILNTLSQAEESGEVFLLIAKAYRLKQKIKADITKLEEEERQYKKQLRAAERKNKKLEKEVERLKGNVANLEAENTELKAQITFLAEFRNQQLAEGKEKKKKERKRKEGEKAAVEESSSSDEETSDHEIDTFNADVQTVDVLEQPKTARGTRPMTFGEVAAPTHTPAASPSIGSSRTRKVSKVVVHIEKEKTEEASSSSEKRVTIAEGKSSKDGKGSTASPASTPKTKTSSSSSSGSIPVISPPSPALEVKDAKETTKDPKRASSKNPTIPSKITAPAATSSNAPSATTPGRAVSTRATKTSTIESSAEERPEEKVSEQAIAQASNTNSETPFDEDMLLDIITGLEVTVKSRNYDQETDKMLIPKDYTYWYQFKVKRSGRELLKFKDFAPKVFYQMRQFWGVSEEAFLKSFEFDNLKPVRGEGKSGAFFIFTKDRQFVLKTATGEERDFLWQILPYYYQYIRRNPNSLLPRFYGIYSMKHEGIGGMTRFVIMNNIFNTPYAPVEKFDLKGSTVGRFVKESKRTPGVILKDLDITEMGRKLYLPDNLRDEFVRQLKKDSDFLATHKVMDYSLLLGIHYETEENKAKSATDLKALQENEGVIKTWMKNDFQKYYNGIKTVRPDGVTEVYYIGIIDILIQFEVKKKLEHLVKSIAYSADEVSVVEPSFYSKRFFDFVSNLVAGEDDEKDDEESSSEDDARISNS